VGAANLGGGGMKIGEKRGGARPKAFCGLVNKRKLEGEERKGGVEAWALF